MRRLILVAALICLSASAHASDPSCYIVGDSLAEGIHLAAPHCASAYRRGISSAAWDATWRRPIKADTVVIALGSNDFEDSTVSMIAIRERVKAIRVYWVRPANHPHVGEMMEMIATEFGDTVLTIQALSPDKVHPTLAEYRRLAEAAGIR